MPANAKILAVVGAITLVLAVIAGVRLTGRGDDDTGIPLDPTVVEPGPTGRVPLRTEPRTRVQSQSTLGALPERHGRQVPTGTPQGFVRVRVLDAKTGERVHGFRVRVYGPGVPIIERRVEGFRAEVPLRIGMPANLEIQAKGYQRADVRQVHLTTQRPSRQLEIRLKAR